MENRIIWKIGAATWADTNNEHLEMCQWLWKWETGIDRRNLGGEGRKCLDCYEHIVTAILV